ncbi:glutamic acid-rich protein-like [Planococcus citri]
MKWPNLFGRKNQDPNSPEGDEFPLAELADDLKKLEEKIPDEHYPVHGLNPHHSEGSEHEPENSPDSHYYSAENPDDKSGNESLEPETMGEMLEEELEELEKEAHSPEKPDHQWPDWSWNHHDDQEPESHKPHSEKHGHDGTHHDGHSPEEEHGSPKHHKESHQPKKHDVDEKEDFSEIPSWFWAPATKDSKSKEHKNHHPQKHDTELYQETNYDVRDIGNNREKAKTQGDDSDGDGTEDEDDDDGSDDDENKDGNETDDNDEDDDNDVGHEKEKGNDEIDPDEEEILKELEERNKEKDKGKKKPKRDSSDEADDDSDSDDEDDDDDDDDDDDGAADDQYLDEAKKNFSIWNLVLPMIKEQLPSIPNPFSVLNRVTVSFGSINDLQRDPEYLQKSLIKKVNQKYNEKHEKALPGTTISFWPPTITRG